MGDCVDDELKPWRIRGTRHALETPWLKVRVDDCVTQEGEEIGPYYLLEYPDWVQIVALDNSDQLILVRQYRHGLGGLSLELPAGSIDASDFNVLAAGARELEEETGYRSTDWRYIAALSPNAANHVNRAHVVLALGAQRLGSPANDPSERVEVVRMSPEDTVQKALQGEIMQAIHVASLLLALTAAGRWPG